MNKEQLIVITDFCISHQVETEWVKSIHGHGLIEIISKEEAEYIQIEELPRLEKILLYHRELKINLEGVEVVLRLLERLQDKEEQIRMMRNRLACFDAELGEMDS